MVGDFRVTVDDDMAQRYAEVSDDWSAHHFDLEAARRSGFDRLFLHGLCTMAFTGRAVLEVAGVADPARVRRLAVRFSAPLFPGDTVTTRIWGLGDGAYGFDAVSGQGATVVKDGRAELHG